MKVVIKIGTQSILSNDGSPLESVIENLVEQIIALKQKGIYVVLVSSGAVSSGRKAAFQTLGKEFGKSIGEKQVLASLGQPKLIYLYSELFKRFNLLVSQVLLTKQDFITRKNYLNIKRLLNEILKHKNIIPIINENDSVAIEELMFTDNDELAGLIATQIGADKLIILSNVEGVYNGHPQSFDSELIPVIDPEKGWPNISNEKSTHGRGGMITKISTARKVSSLGITTHIVNISQKDVLLRILKGDSVGTIILPSQKKSNIKRWISYSTEQTNGSIVINRCLYEILKENKRVISILPVGIEKCCGHFKRGDAVDIIAPHGEKIGIGISRYDHKKLSELCNQKNGPVFMHYDYFHIF
jgi:glutamate 5-kinase